MYKVRVRDRVMIAHSFKGAVFGPAQRLHGATFVVDATFTRPDLDGDGIVVDIGAASQALRSILAELDYRNLDDLPAFAGRNSTTEVVARWVHDQLAAAIDAGRLGPGGGAISHLAVEIMESDIASASYGAPR